MFNLAQLQTKQTVKFYACGAEQGQGGYLHWQGAIIFNHGQTKRGSGLKKLISDEAHIEVMKGDTKRAIKYCTKEGSLCFQKGLDDLFGEGKEEKARKRSEKARTQKDELAREITKDLDEMEPEEFADKWPSEWLRNRRRCEEFLTEGMGRRATVWKGNLQAKNFWVWGKPGIGKSRWATEQAPVYKTYRKNVNKWWDGYSICSHNTVIIEDYPCLPHGDCLTHHVKVWADRYPFTAEKKCAHLQVETGRFILIVTSNHPIERCFANPEDVEAIRRRFNEIEMTRANKVLVNNLKADYGILTQRNPPGGMMDLSQIDISEEEGEDLERALAEEMQMEAESQELGDDEMGEREEKQDESSGGTGTEEW
jgi:hypothetical protein